MKKYFSRVVLLSMVMVLSFMSIFSVVWAGSRENVDDKKITVSCDPVYIGFKVGWYSDDIAKAAKNYGVPGVVKLLDSGGKKEIATLQASNNSSFNPKVTSTGSTKITLSESDGTNTYVEGIWTIGNISPNDYILSSRGGEAWTNENNEKGTLVETRTEAGYLGCSNLTASAPAPTSAVAGALKTFTATISNNGSADIKNSFSSFFQTANRPVDPNKNVPVSGATVTDRSPAASTSELKTKDSVIVTSPPITFPSAGTYSMRSCADKSNSLSSGSISESNELDNCGPWVNITVTGTPPSPTNLVLSCSVPGTTVTASWTAPYGGWNNFYFRANLGRDNVTWPPLVRQDSVVGTSTRFASLPGQTYYAWVHTKNPADGSWSGAIGQNITCAPSSAPDLTASTPAPDKAIENAAQTYSSTILNIGNSIASGTITHLFQFDEDPDHKSVSATRTANTREILGGSNDSVSATYSFKVGTRYVRVCADNDASFKGTVEESDEDNNCSAWNSVEVKKSGDEPPPPPPPGCAPNCPLPPSVRLYVTTSPITKITLPKAKGGGVVTPVGGAEVRWRGVVWGEDIDPTIELLSKTRQAGESGSFESTLFGLVAGKKYYVRAYALDGFDEPWYGDNVIFLKVKPIFKEE